MKTRLPLPLALLAGLVLAPAAAAHVEISPNKVHGNGFTRFTIEVPTERNVPTIKVEVKLPPGLASIRPAATPDWTIRNRDGVLSWSGGKIKPGESGKFVFTAHVPDKPGTELVFPTIQTYAKGPVERWIFGAGSETPAPRVKVTAGFVSIPTLPVNDGSTNHRGVALAIGVALVGALLALGVVLFRRRRA